MTNLFGVKIVHFTRHVGTGPFRLRWCRLRDLYSLYSLAMPEIFPEGEKSKRPPRSFFSFYRWIKGTFQVIYLIEIQENGGRRVIGFAGLYDMELGRNLRISLTIFNPDDRQRGYGEKALIVLLGLLQENGAADMVYAEILKGNAPSLRLCRKLGFKVKKLYQDKLLLEMDQRRKSGEG
jgi:RimJ/RimL family protein N-acetyltransferase